MLIYWFRFIPRLLILAAAGFLIWWNQNALLTWQVKNQIESNTGAKVRLESVHGDLAAGNVVINDLELYDPKSPRRKPISVAKITARGDFNNIALRYLVFPRIDLEGIKVTVDGVDGQELVPDRLWLQFKDRIPKGLSQGLEQADDFDWTLFLSEKPEDAAKTLLERFETSRLTEDIKRRWPEDVKKIETNAKSVETRFQTIKQLFEKQTRPEDKLELIGRLLQELEGVDLEIRSLLADAESLKNKAQGDYQSLQTAVNRDRETVKTLQAPTVSLDHLSESLIGPEIAEQWSKTLAWGDWARSLFVPVRIDEKKAGLYEHFGFAPPEDFKGETIHLAALDARPDLLIKTVNLTGQIHFGELPIFFNGSVQNVAHLMQLGPEPTVAQFCFSNKGIPVSPVREAEVDLSRHSAAPPFSAVETIDGIPDVYVTVSVDRIGENEEDHLTVHCPGYRHSERVLGNPEKFAISVAPGLSRLDGVLTLQGDRLVGQLRIIQTQTRLGLVLPEKFHHSPFYDALRQTLDSLDGFTAEIQVGGSRDEPQYVFKTDLADRLRPQIEHQLLSEWNNIRQKIDTQVTAEANQAIDVLRASVNEQIDPLLGQIDAQRNHWQQQIAQGAGLPMDQLFQTQLSKLSPQDQQRIGQFMQSPLMQSVLQNRQAADPIIGAGQGTATGTPQQTEQMVNEAIQGGVEKLQEKLPGLLDRLRSRSDR